MSLFLKWRKHFKDCANILLKRAFEEVSFKVKVGESIGDVGSSNYS